MKRLLAWLRSQSWLTKGVIVAAILFAAFLFYGWGKGTVYDLRSWLFERRQAEVTERERKLEQESNEWKRKAEIAEARAAQEETKRKLLEGLIAENGGKIERERQRLEKELEAIRSDAGSCGSIADRVERERCVLAKLSR